MITFLTAVALLIAGYFIYGAVVERVFGADPKRKTPAYTMQDGVDYFPMPTWKVFLIQFLNIAGTGPIFGAILGMLYGPSAYLWIVFGCIFGGAVHDYLSGMISVRRGGCSLPEIIGDELGSKVRLVMRAFALFMLILVGAMFVLTPAGLLATLTPTNGFWGGTLFWCVVVFIYYICATLLPIDKLIGRIYPVFGFALLFMALGVLYGVLTTDGYMPEITEAFTNHHPTSAMPIFPGICITIACGAVSGFHATQSPLMARCMKSEKFGRGVFYGSMITEGLVACIWAAAAIKFADTLSVAGETPYEKLLTAMKDETGAVNPAIVVNAICNSWLGKAGAVLAVLGVVAAPITSGDTAFRSARLIAADFLRFKQDKIAKRLIISVPLFAIALALMFIDFQILWRYFAWGNQMLSVFTFWAITVWLARERKCFYIGLVPALFMTMVCTTYIFIAPEGFQFPHAVSYLLGGAVTILLLVMFARSFTRSFTRSFELSFVRFFSLSFRPKRSGVEKSEQTDKT